MQPRINHQPTDRNKVRWKSWALLALIGFWLTSGVVGRDLGSPMNRSSSASCKACWTLSLRTGWWRPMVAGVAVDSESILIHWLNAPLVLALKSLLPLHEAARITNVLWTSLGVAALFAAARRWSGGHISHLAAIIAIGCVGLYDRAHAYGPDIPVFAAVALALYGCACPAEAPRRQRWRLRQQSSSHSLDARCWGLPSSHCHCCCSASRPCIRCTGWHWFALCCSRVSSFARSGWRRLRCVTVPVFAEWVDADFGLKAGGSRPLRPDVLPQYAALVRRPAWPVAIWLVTLRARGFGGGWQRGEVIAPIIFAASAFAAVSALTEPRAVHTLYLLPPIIMLAAFGVDTLKRTWYALIDWFGILVLGLTAIAVVLVASSIYFGWPPMIAQRITAYVPNLPATRRGLVTAWR